MDPRRWLPLLRLAAFGLILLVVVDQALARAYGALDTNAVITDHLDPERLESIGSRVSAALAQRGDAPVAVLLGQSATREGFDVDLLAEADPGPRRWLNLGASGGSIRQLHYYAEGYLYADLHPELLVVSVQVQWLSEPDRRVRDQRVQASTPGPLGMLFFFRDRNSLGNLLRHAARTSALDLWRATGLPGPVVFPPEAYRHFRMDGEPDPDDPWDSPRRYAGPHASEAYLEQLVAHWSEYGWFDPAAYDPEGPEPRELALLLRRLRPTADRLVLLHPPQHSALRTRVPGAADASFDAALQASGVDAVVVDHRAAMPDHLFHDHGHLDAEGRAVYSRWFPGALAAALAGEPAPPPPATLESP
ncbi:MAG: hypothetical protein H6732_10230 [Alphaproteobacteria bacterium]|nr:hypothetical protein [Alphaproteobacteria bacterium]